MKKAIELIKSIFFNTAGIYLAVSMFLAFGFKLVGEMEDNAVFQYSMLFNSLLFAFLSGLCISVFGMIKKLGVVRFFLDFIFSFGALYLSFFRLTDLSGQLSWFFAVSTLYIIVFAAVCGLSVLVKKLTGEKKKEEYENIYS